MSSALTAQRRQALGGTLVLGGGFGGSAVARALGRDGTTIVDLRSYLLFTPFLAEVASGTLEPRRAAVPLRALCPHAELLVGRLHGLDAGNRLAFVETELGEVELEYEDLIVGLGSVPRWLPIEGLAEHALSFKSLADAVVLRDHALRELDAADQEPAPERIEQHLTFLFVGAGYAGVEALAQLQDLVREALRHHPRLRGRPMRWILVDAAPRILPEVPETLARYAAHELERRGVEVRTTTTLVSVDAGCCARLSDGTAIPTHTLVWAVGGSANPVVAHLGLPVDERGRLRVGPTLQVEGHRHVWGLGDCAAVPNAAAAGRFDPPTSQHALRQARRLVANLRAARVGRSARPYRYAALGQVATLGHQKGIADVLGVHVRGPLGWGIAESYHLLQLPLFGRRLRAAADWTLATIARRDVVQIDAFESRGPLAELPADMPTHPHELGARRTIEPLHR